ncbi:MAG: 2,3,4,5-tetrahydropyridine-2,6-dicarboxylate N-succinyltransferase [Spirochaetales bacterium]
MSSSAIAALEMEFEAKGRLEAGGWASFLEALESGELAATRREENGEWVAVSWVKKAILSGFKAGGLSAWDWPGGAFDRPAFPPRRFELGDGVRVVPGGSSSRRGAHIAAGVVIMPPSYINVGASIGAGTMVDSHVLVGSCARVGERVHLSAGVQVGGVLEPPQARPVVVEDGAFIGGLCGIFEGIVIRTNAVLAPGVILSKSTRIFDLVKGREWIGEVPASAVVVPGARPARGEYALGHGLSLQAPIIVKYRDEGTEASVTLEDALR